MPVLVVNAGFFIMLTNSYELAHEAFRDRPLRDKRAELSRMVVNTGALCFVRVQISMYMPHTLYAWVHHEMVEGAFLDGVVKECSEFEWFESQSKGTFERERRLSNKLMAAATVRRVTPDPNMSVECELYEVITSLGATAGTVLRQFSTTNSRYPNALDCIGEFYYCNDASWSHSTLVY